MQVTSFLERARSYFDLIVASNLVEKAPDPRVENLTPPGIMLLFLQFLSFGRLNTIDHRSSTFQNTTITKSLAEHQCRLVAKN